MKSYAGDSVNLLEDGVDLNETHWELGPPKAGELGPVLGADDCSYSASLQDSEQ